MCRCAATLILALCLGLAACERELPGGPGAGEAGRREAPRDTDNAGVVRESEGEGDRGGSITGQPSPDARPVAQGDGPSDTAPTPPAAEARRPSAEEAERIAAAQEALAGGDALAALSLVLGTPPVALTPSTTATDGSGQARATVLATALASPPLASLPADTPTPGPPLGGGALAEVLPQLPPAAVRLYAQALAEAGRPRGAAQAWEALARSLPSLADRFWLEAGSAHFKAGDDAAALRAFDAALASQSAGPERSADQRSLAQLRRGNALLRLGRAEEALTAYGAAELPEASEMARGQALAGAIAAQLAAGRPDEAAALRLRLLRQLPGSSLAPTALGRLKEAGVAVPPLDEARVLAAAGDAQAAATVAAIEPPASPAPADADSFLQAARAGDGSAWFRAGWSAWRQGLPGEAQAAWEEGLSALGEDARSGARIAQLHHWAGRAAAARRAMGRSSILRPKKSVPTQSSTKPEGETSPSPARASSSAARPSRRARRRGRTGTKNADHTSTNPMPNPSPTNAPISPPRR